MPTGGEFFTIPVQKDTSRYATSAKIVQLPVGDGQHRHDRQHAELHRADRRPGQQAQLAADASLQPGSPRSGVAKARTGDNLGTKYPIISQQLWTAVQKAESGAARPRPRCRPRRPRPRRRSTSSTQAAGRRESHDNGAVQGTSAARRGPGRRTPPRPRARGARTSRKARSGAVGGVGRSSPRSSCTSPSSTPTRSTATSTCSIRSYTVDVLRQRRRPVRGVRQLHQHLPAARRSLPR